MLSREYEAERGWSRRRAAIPVLVVIALLAATTGHAARKAGRATVSGKVTNTAGEPLAGIEITLEAAGGEQATTSTDKRGEFSIAVAEGDYLVALQGEGYAPFESPLSVVAGGSQVVTVQLLDAAAGRRSEAALAFNAGADAFEAGDKEAAKASFLAAIEADPTLLKPYRVLADIYLDEGAWAAAAQAAETVLAADPDNRGVQRIAYEAYRELDDLAKVALLRRALGTDPELAPKLAVHAFNEGAIADQGGDAETATTRFREALELDPELTAAHFAVATLEFRAGRYDDALTNLENGLDLEPASSQGRRLGFLIQDARADLAAAAEALDAYATVDAPGAADILYKRGEVDFRNGESESARRAFLKVIEILPEHTGAHHNLGLAYLTVDAELAKKHLRRFLELAPDDPEASVVQEILANLE